MSDPTVIAFMGVTGAGKSSFVKALTGRDDIVVGHGLKSTTSSVKSYKVTIGATRFELIDTPGFNDTFRSEQEILRELAEWLGQTYSEGHKLTGIIYLHPIYAARVEGSARLNLCAFRKLCGMHAFRHIALCTTFWDTVDHTEGSRRESELCATSEFWGDMIDRGACYERITSYASSHGLLSRMAEKAPVTLTIQKEIVDDQRALLETEAGQALHAETAQLQEDMERQIKETKARLESLQQQKQRKREQEAELRRRANEDFEKAQKACEEAQRQELQRLQRQISEAEQEAKEVLEQEKRRAAELKREKERMAAEAERLRARRKEEEERAGEQRVHLQELKQRAKCRSALEHFRAQVNTLNEAQSRRTIKVSILPNRLQSPAFLRFCGGCLIKIGWNAATFHKCGSCQYDLCAACWTQGRRCDCGSMSEATQFKGNGTCRRISQTIDEGVLCDVCRTSIVGLYFHCCQCADDDMDVCLQCAITGKTCKSIQHSLHPTVTWAKLR